MHPQLASQGGDVIVLAIGALFVLIGTVAGAALWIALPIHLLHKREREAAYLMRKSPVAHPCRLPFARRSELRAGGGWRCPDCGSRWTVIRGLAHTEVERDPFNRPVQIEVRDRPYWVFAGESNPPL